MPLCWAITAELPWATEGIGKPVSRIYAAACRMLADHLAQTVNLNSKDKLLDLGCGSGRQLAALAATLSGAISGRRVAAAGCLCG